MLLADKQNIREVTLFPMNQNAQDLMMNAPSYVSDDQLKELNIKMKQKCKRIIFSRLFETNYKDKKTFLGVMKFNLFSRITSKELIPLGGIRENNLQLTRLTNSKGICILSEAKKKPAKIISRLF